MVCPISQPAELRLRSRPKSKNVYAEVFFVTFGLRSYNPALGRWINRDPIGERGGVNLMGFVGNETISFFDFLGMEAALELARERLKKARPFFRALLCKSHYWDDLNPKAMTLLKETITTPPPYGREVSTIEFYRPGQKPGEWTKMDEQKWGSPREVMGALYWTDDTKKKAYFRILPGESSRQIPETPESFNRKKGLDHKDVIFYAHVHPIGRAAYDSDNLNRPKNLREYMEISSVPEAAEVSGLRSLEDKKRTGSGILTNDVGWTDDSRRDHFVIEPRHIAFIDYVPGGLPVVHQLPEETYELLGFKSREGMLNYCEKCWKKDGVERD